MTIQDLAALLTSVFTIVTAGFVGWQVRKMAESIMLSRLQTQHQLCLEIWREYNAVFEERQALLQEPINFDSLRARYPDVREIVNSEEYKRLKRVAGVYILAGSLVESGAIQPQVIFEYISVPPELWLDHMPLIAFLREHYHRDLWLRWEQLANRPENSLPLIVMRPNDRRESAIPLEP